MCRRYWRNNLKTVRALGVRQGGEFVADTHFTHAGGPILSLLSLISYLGKGENPPRYLSVPIPPASLKPDYLTRARIFANSLADRIVTGTRG